MLDGSDELLPEGRLVIATIEMRLPATANRQQVEEWVLHHFGADSLDLANPLCNFEPELFAGQVMLTDTFMQGDTERRYIGQEGSKTFFKTKYTRTPAAGTRPSDRFMDWLQVLVHPLLNLTIEKVVVALVIVSMLFLHFR